MTITSLIAEMRPLLTTRSVLLRRAARLEAEATCTGGVGDGMPRARSSEPRLQRVCLEIGDVQKELSEVEQELSVYRRKLEPAVDRLPLGVSRMLIRLRYLDWLSMADVARMAGYSRQNVYRALKSAENMLCAATLRQDET